MLAAGLVQEQGDVMNELSTIDNRGNGSSNAVVASAESRAVAEVQAAMAIAKRFPRDELAASAKIMQACQRRSLAEVSQYAYPRGTATVSGPSIRLAEAIAQRWGNLDFGIVELSQSNGESVVMAYCTDLETNVRQVKTFTVRHERKVRRKGRGQSGYDIVSLDDPRDVYEMTANNGARRLRACILGVIPGDVVEEARLMCDKTLAGPAKKPLIDRVKDVVVAFVPAGVTQEMIEAKLGHNIDVTTETELVSLIKIGLAIKDGAAKREDFFGFPQSTKPNTTLADLARRPTAEPGQDALGTGQDAPQSTNTEQAESHDQVYDGTLFNENPPTQHELVDVHRELSEELDRQTMGESATRSLLESTAKVSRIEDLSPEMAQRVLDLLRARGDDE